MNFITFKCKSGPIHRKSRWQQPHSVRDLVRKFESLHKRDDRYVLLDGSTFAGASQ